MKRYGKKQYTTPRDKYWWPYDSKHTILDLANERVPFANVGKDTTVFKPGTAPREIIGPEIGDVGGIPPAPGPYRPPAPYRRSAPRFRHGAPPQRMMNDGSTQTDPFGIDKPPAPEPNPLAEAVEMDTTSEPETNVYQDSEELFQQQPEYLPEYRPILRTDPIEDVEAIFPPTQPPLAQAGPVRITPAQLIEMQKNKGFKPEILGLRPATRPPGGYKRTEDPIVSEMAKRFQESPEEVVIEDEEDDEDEEDTPKPTASDKGKSKISYATLRKEREEKEKERQREEQEVLQEVYGGPAPPEEPQIMDVERARAEKRKAESDYARIMRPQPTMTQRPRGQPRKPYRPTSEPVIVEIPPEDFIPPPVQPGRIAIEGPQNADEPQIHIPQAPRRQGPSRRAIRGFLPPQRIIEEDDDYEDIPEIRVGDLPAYQEEQPAPEPAPPPPRAPKAKRPFRMSARDAAEFKNVQARFYADIGQLTSRYRRIMKADNVDDSVKHRVKAAMDTYVSISLLNLVYIAHGLKPPFPKVDIENFHEYVVSGVNIMFYERTLAENVTEALDLYEQATEKLINTANRQIYDSLNLAKKERERLLKI